MQLISRHFGALICVAALSGAASAQDIVLKGSANVDQIPGNIAIIQQQSGNNNASIEQKAILGATFANEAIIAQSGAGDSASVKQRGQDNAAQIAQTSNNETATVKQYGWNLGVQIIQSVPGSTVTVTQYGTSTPGAPPITVKQF